jgi:LysM repeat protein
MSPIAATPPAAPPPPAVVRIAGSAPAGWQAYTIRAGDTLVDIAQRLGTTPNVLAAQNQLPGGGRLIRTGSVILVPGMAAAAPAPAPAPAAGSTAYTVRAGDTVSQIALRTPATARQIMAANGLGPRTHIRPGQVLTIPGPAPAAPAASAPGQAAAANPARVSTTEYRVRAGETIEGIAGRSGVSQASLITANNLAAPYLIHVGQLLRLQKPAPQPSAANTFAGRTYPDATVAAAAATRETLRRAGAPSREAMRSIIEATARRHGIDPRLALAVAYQESGLDQRQVSVANAVGAMQVIPSSGEWASSLVGRRLDLLRAEDNATAGVVILRALTRSATSLEEAIAGYYQGLASVRSNGMYADTQQYVVTITALMARS